MGSLVIGWVHKSAYLQCPNPVYSMYIFWTFVVEGHVIILLFAVSGIYANLSGGTGQFKLRCPLPCKYVDLCY